MLKIEEKMYVRTRNGIAKILGIINDPDNFYYKMLITDKFLKIHDDTEYIDDLDVIKASNNIIDLIEEGDYVNGVEVIGKEFDNFNKEYLQCGVGDYVICTFEVKDIKTILTKEQFESQKYIVESE